MLTSIPDVPPAPPGTRIAYSRGEFQFGELRVPSGSGPHPVAIVIHGGHLEPGIATHLEIQVEDGR